jgi:hypothetical protein
MAPFDLLMLLKFDLNADPDPDFHFNADPYFHFNGDPDLASPSILTYDNMVTKYNTSSDSSASGG